MSQNDLGVGRPSIKIPTTEQAATAAQTTRTARSGKTIRGASTDNLTVERASVGPQYSANAIASGPELPLPSPVNATDLMAILFTLRQKHTESSIESAELRIHDRSVDKDTKSKEMIEKLQKVAHSKSNVGATVGKVFAWVGVALSFVVAGIIGVVSGGAAAAPLLIIATMSAALLISQQSGLTEKVMDSMGMDDKAKMALSIGIAAIMLVVSIGAVVVSGGASAASAVTEVTDIAAAGGGAAAEAGATAASTAAEVGATAANTAAETGATAAKISASVVETTTEMTLESSTKATEIITNATADAIESSVEASTKAAELAAKTSADVAESAVKTSVDAAESAVKTSADAAESAAKTSVDAAESAAKTSADAAEKVAAKVPTAVKTIAEKLGVSSSRVLKVVSKVRSGIGVARGGTEIVTGGLAIDSTVTSYKATKAHASALRDKAVLAKMQAQDEDDLRRIRNMIEQLENAQTAIMSTISKSDEVALQIRQTI